MKAIKLVVSIAAASLLGGCVAAAASGGAAGGYYYEKDKTSIKHYVGDAAITSKVKAKYLKDLALKSFNVSVSTNHGIVSLVGNVPTMKLRHRAITVAKHTEGVIGVDAHNLTVSHHHIVKANVMHGHHKTIHANTVDRATNTTATKVGVPATK